MRMKKIERIRENKRKEEKRKEKKRKNYAKFMQNLCKK